MAVATSYIEVKKSAAAKTNYKFTWIAMLVWLGLSLLGEQLFIDDNPRLDTGAIFVSGGGPILLISAMHLLVSGVIRIGLFIRIFFGILCIALGVGELTDTDKGVIWVPALAGMLGTIIAAVVWRVGRRWGAV